MFRRKNNLVNTGRIFSWHTNERSRLTEKPRGYSDNTFTMFVQFIQQPQLPWMKSRIPSVLVIAKQENRTAHWRHVRAEEASCKRGRWIAARCAALRGCTARLSSWSGTISPRRICMCDGPMCWCVAKETKRSTWIFFVGTILPYCFHFTEPACPWGTPHGQRPLIKPKLFARHDIENRTGERSPRNVTAGPHMFIWDEKQKS